MSNQESIKNHDMVEFPSTRYRGSKRKIRDWVWSTIDEYEFDTFLDGFSGTCCIGFEAKKNGKQVYVNDILEFNHIIGRAIIENDSQILTEEDIKYILKVHSGISYPTLIQDEFQGKYYKDEENVWLDKIVTNIHNLDDKYKKALAFAALGQACLAKRPFNLFHRANLDMRTRDVERSFGNKTTWEKPFPELFSRYVKEYNGAVFDNNRNNRSYNLDIFDLNREADLVYFDPPYLSNKTGGTNYQYYYHFLEGILNYDNWREMINRELKTYRIKHDPTIWNNKSAITSAFETLFEKYQDTTIVLSYNTQGIPSVGDLEKMMGKFKSDVRINTNGHNYVLSENNDVKEVLLIGTG